jgi:hypothetical protein
MASFYNAEEMKKGHFITVISKYRWYYIKNRRKFIFAAVFVFQNLTSIFFWPNPAIRFKFPIMPLFF